MVCGRGTQAILRARGRWLAWSSGPSTSPLDVTVMDSQPNTQSPRPPDLEARVRYLPTAEGGRPRPVQSGILTSDFGLPGTLTMAMHQYPERGCAFPGEESRALLWFLSPELQRGRLFAGLRFTVQDGPKIIGHGEITRVVNTELARDV